MERIGNVYEVTQRLCGIITPYGDSNIDQTRLQNLKDTISVADKLIDDIIEVSKFSIRKEHSIVLLSTEAKDFLTDLREKLNSIK
jgi:hypothetical protein